MLVRAAREAIEARCTRIERLHSHPKFAGSLNWTYVALVAGLTPPGCPTTAYPHCNTLRAIPGRLERMIAEDLVCAPDWGVELLYRCSRARCTALRAQQIFGQLNGGNRYCVPEEDITERRHWDPSVLWPSVPSGPLLANIAGWATGEFRAICSMPQGARRGLGMRSKVLEAYLVGQGITRDEILRSPRSRLNGVRPSQDELGDDIWLAGPPEGALVHGRAFVTPLAGGVRVIPVQYPSRVIPELAGPVIGEGRVRPVNRVVRPSPAGSPLLRRLELAASPLRVSAFLDCQLRIAILVC